METDLTMILTIRQCCDIFKNNQIEVLVS